VSKKYYFTHSNRLVFNFILWLSVYVNMLFGSTFSDYFGFIIIVFVSVFTSLGVSVFSVFSSFFSSGFLLGNILPIAESTVLIGSICIGSPSLLGFGSFPPPAGGSYLCCGISPILLSYCCASAGYISGGIYHGICYIS